MKLLLPVVSLFWSLAAQEGRNVTYVADRASVQDVVQTISAQAGLDYDWQKSFDQTNPLCRRWVSESRLYNVPFDTAMHRILDPVGLRYVVEDGKVVLVRSAPL